MINLIKKSLAPFLFMGFGLILGYLLSWMIKGSTDDTEIVIGFLSCFLFYVLYDKITIINGTLKTNLEIHEEARKQREIMDRTDKSCLNILKEHEEQLSHIGKEVFEKAPK